MTLHNTIGYSVPPYRLVQDLMQDCYTSRTAIRKSYNLLTPTSYTRHHSNTPVAHPLTSNAIRAWFSHTRQLNQCRVHQWKLQQE
jgi:hypothetical protein